MKMSRQQRYMVVGCLILSVGLSSAGLYLRRWSGVGRIRTDGITSYYVYSGAGADHEGKRPAIIIVGHPLDSPRKDLAAFRDRFDEPVLLLWSGLLTGLSEGCHVDDEAVWARKRQQFLRLLDGYKKKLNIDEKRVYLTGFSFAGVYAWMLAYDRPELYAAVVPMSATSYPRQIQERLEAAKTVVTVVVRGEKDDTLHLEGEKQTGRIIEAYNPRSRFILKPGEGHSQMGKYWLENLQYVLQFERKDTHQEYER